MLSLLPILPCVLLSRAVAAVPVQLPSGESSAAWVEPLALAGLAQVEGGATPAAVVRAEGPRWSIRVEGVAGHGRTVVVPAPTTAQAREDLAWLLASLLQPVGVRAEAPVTASAELPRPVIPAPVRPPAPAATPLHPPERATSPPTASAVVATSPAGPVLPGTASPATEPAPPVVTESAPVATAIPPVPASEGAAVPGPWDPAEPPAPSVSPPPSTSPAPAVASGDTPPAPAVVAPPAGAPATAETPSAAPVADVVAGEGPGGRATIAGSPSVGVWVGPAAGVHARPEAAAGPTFALSGGLWWQGGWRIGASAAWEPETALAALGADRTLGGASLVAVGGWTGTTIFAPSLTGELGGARRQYTEGDAAVGAVYTPLVGGSAGIRFAPVPGFGLVLDASLRCDLRGTDVLVPDADPRALPPCGGGGGLRIEVGPPGGVGFGLAPQSSNPGRGSRHLEGA